MDGEAGHSLAVPRQVQAKAAVVLHPADESRIGTKGNVVAIAFCSVGRASGRRGGMMEPKMGAARLRSEET